LLESVGQSVIAADADGKINYWNKVAEQTYGWSAEEAKGTQIEENLQEILSSGMRARELIKQILALSRHSVNIDKPFPIEPLVKKALQMLRSVIPTSIEFRENITSEQLVVKADPTQIHQVVVNLATNAKQAMTNGFGVLEIRLERVNFDEDVRSLHPEIGPGKYARISVSDTGCGIPEEDLGKIFEPYFTTKGNEIGTGMGLSVVHGNVRKSNGHIIVDSEVGKGTTFHVYLPLVEKAEPVYTSETIESIPKGVADGHYDPEAIRWRPIENQIIIIILLTFLISMIESTSKSRPNGLDCLNFNVFTKH
jgi:signal transduction histidine kinase